MKKVFALSLAVLMAFALCACGGGDVSEPSPYAGKYLCTSIVLEGMELGADGEYLELRDGGKCSFFLYESPDEGTWELDGEALSITIPYEDIVLSGTGTLKDGVIVMEIPEMGDASMTFQLEGMETEEPPTEEAPDTENPAEQPSGEEPAPEASGEEAAEAPA